MAKRYYPRERIEFLPKISVDGYELSGDLESVIATLQEWLSEAPNGCKRRIECDFGYEGNAFYLITDREETDEEYKKRVDYLKYENNKRTKKNRDKIVKLENEERALLAKLKEKYEE